MVQRKAPPKVGPQAETKKSHAKLERQTSCLHQEGGGDLKKKMKLERSFRAADLEILQDYPMKQQPKKRSPNYMKPTSSSDARKEKLQVTLHPRPSSTDHRKRTPRNSKNSISSKTSTSSSSSPSSYPSYGLKLTKSLSRQSSLKAIRPLIKKNLNLIKDVAVNRATCSSTIKDCKFPAALDLNPGGSEADGTSVMRVCPYTYCSLNGHRHEALPPLKCFMSARRKLLKTQKSMKLKEVALLRQKVLGEEEGIDTGQKATSKVSSRLEEPDDFFVEIYASSGLEEQIVDEKSQVEDDTEESQCLKEPSEGETVEDGREQNSDVSNEDADAMMCSLEYVECDQQVDEAEEERTPSLVAEDDEELQVECHVVGLLEKADEGAGESEGKASTFDFNWEEEVGSPYPDNMTECSEISTEHIALLNACDEAQANEEQQQEAYQEAAEEDNEMSVGNELVAIVEADAELEHCEVTEIHDAMAEKPEVEDVNTFYLCDSEPTISDTSFQGEGFSEKEEEGTEAGHALPELTHDKSNENDGSEEQQDLIKENIRGQENENEADGSEEQQDVIKENIIAQENENENDGSEEQQGLLKQEIKGQENENEVKDTDSFSIDDLKEPGQCITEYGGSKNCPHVVCKCDEETEDADTSSDTQSCYSSSPSDDSDIEESWESENEEEAGQIGGSTAKLNARIIIGRRKKMEEELDEMREFNPRPPRFLDVEPDPEAEKVDLRHQEMDGRKNSEEYLIDYALQQAVTKLAPARKRKVALLVEAFETVMPLPACEKPLRHSASGFIHAGIMQACI